MRFQVWCTKTGGVTGSASAWLKVNDVIAVFPSMVAAEAEASKLNQAMNGPYSTAYFYYRAVEVCGGE